MNWSLLAMMGLMFLITIVMSITVIFFIRHWANRSTSSNNALANNEGNYFVRYIPPGCDSIEHTEPQLKTRNLRKATQYALSSAFALAIIGLLSATTYANRDKLASRIDLTEQELASLKFKKHRWEYKDFQNLPELKIYLEKLREHKQGLLLLSSNANNPWPTRNGDLTKQSRRQWENFATTHKLEIKHCAWEKLEKCGEKTKGWINILLPGLWDQEGVKGLLDSGAKIIAYGPPQQIYMNKNQPFKLNNLSFHNGLIPDTPDLSLKGDRALSLGFDAGMIINVQPTFTDYYAESTNPQAVSISTQHLAGGESTTRLYADATSEGGKLVWMDFSPNIDDHDEVTPYYFQALLGSVFRYMDSTPYSSWANWPEGKPFAALLEEDTEDQFGNARYVAEYFKEKNYPITWYALSNEAQENRELTRMLAETGEIACHGDNHMDFPLQNLKTQQIRIARCGKVLQEITGQTVQAFRPPREEHNVDTLNAMINTGISHFIAKVSGDRFTPAVYGTNDNETALISLPRMNTDDYLLWNELELSDKDSIEQLKQEVHWIKEIGGLFLFSFHTQYMDDQGHLQTVKDIADHIHNNQAFFATASDIAAWWRMRITLQQGEGLEIDAINKFKPVLLHVDKNGILSRKTMTTSSDIALAQQKELP